MPCFNQKLTNSIVQEIYLTILVRKTIPDLHAVVITNGREHALVNRTSALIWTRINSLLMEDIFSIPQYNQATCAREHPCSRFLLSVEINNSSLPFTSISLNNNFYNDAKMCKGIRLLTTSVARTEELKASTNRL